MIELKELNPHNYPTTPEIDTNLQTLLDKMNQVRSAYNVPMIVTSGLRDSAQQQALIAAGKSNAPKSKHLMGQACDIQDLDGTLRDWVKSNMELMETIGFWFEDFDHTKGWVHFQIVQYGSWKPGKSRTFIP